MNRMKKFRPKRKRRYQSVRPNHKKPRGKRRIKPLPPWHDDNGYLDR